MLVWTQPAAGGAWASKLLRDFKVPVWKVSWSVSGSVLAVRLKICAPLEREMWDMKGGRAEEG